MFTHDIDPIIATLGGVHVWWYGLSYSLGFLNAHFFVRRHRTKLGLSLRAVFDLSLLLTIGVLTGGRLVEIVCYEWPFYREHLQLAPAFWLGGMATHGLMLGGLLGVWAFARLHSRSFLEMADLLAIPAAFILGVGRLGNFIDGQIVGSVTTAWWAVKFPDADGFRHPVVLYDGSKNLLIIPLLALLARRRPPTGVLTGVFLFLYAFLRIFVDLFREYPTTLLGLATGQSLNIAMSLGGLAFWLARRNAPLPTQSAVASEETTRGLGWRRGAFAALLIFSLSMPSDWTQDVPTRYGKRHVGLVHSSIYPTIGTQD